MMAWYNWLILALTTVLWVLWVREIRSRHKVTRFEVIDESGRVLMRRPVHVELAYQDDGRTLKVFLASSTRE
jgi:hypothetical protein